jgi:hypothetical protein
MQKAQYRHRSLVVRPASIFEMERMAKIALEADFVLGYN